MQSKDLTRNCSNCQKILTYKSQSSYLKAVKKSATCRACKFQKQAIPDYKIEPMLVLNSYGKSNRQIAKILDLNHRTVGEYLARLGKESSIANQPIDIISDTEARCSKCKDVKPIDEFQFGRKGQKYEYRFSFCNACRRKQIRLNLNSDIVRFLNDHYNRTKLRAKKNNILFNLTKSQYIEQYNKQNGLCFFTDEKMVCELGSGKHKNSLSIDKIIPEKGYIVGNFVFASNKINTCKNDLSLDEIQKWMPSFYLKIKEFVDEYYLSMDTNKKI